MDTPGVFELTTSQITVAGTFTSDWVDGLDGLISLSIQAQLAYGAGGTSVACYVQTSFDQEQTAVDIAAISFTTAGKVALLNLSSETPVTAEFTPTDGAMSLDTVKDGLLGDRFRVKYVVVGTYTSSTVLSVRIVAR